MWRKILRLHEKLPFRNCRIQSILQSRAGFYRPVQPFRHSVTFWPTEAITMHNPVIASPPTAFGSDSQKKADVLSQHFSQMNSVLSSGSRCWVFALAFDDDSKAPLRASGERVCCSRFSVPLSCTSPGCSGDSIKRSTSSFPFAAGEYERAIGLNFNRPKHAVLFWQRSVARQSGYQVRLRLLHSAVPCAASLAMTERKRYVC